MRLIDADKLVVDLKEFVENIKNIRDDSKCFLTEENVLSIIEEQPTAYDVDKVLEKFDKYKDMYKRYIANYHMTLGESSRGKLRLVEHLEEIVKEGGLDE